MGIVIENLLIKGIGTGKELSKCIECKLAVSERHTRIWCRFSTKNCEDPYKQKNIDCPYN